MLPLKTEFWAKNSKTTIFTEKLTKSQEDLFLIIVSGTQNQKLEKITYNSQLKLGFQSKT